MGRSQRDEEHIAGDNVTISVGTGHSLTMDNAPAGVTVSAAKEWLKVNVKGNTYYVPMWSS